MFVFDLALGRFHRSSSAFGGSPGSVRGRKKGGPQAHLSQRIRLRTKVNAEYSHRESAIKRDFRPLQGRRRAQTSIISVTGPSLTSSTSIAAPNSAPLGAEQLADEVVEGLGDLRLAPLR